ncbi:MYND-type zinc finger-containing chromatin reader ZMYND8-like isoform X2 [Oscarella lobularis]|uniref:MYND-type zinc finger-containing chromatin reader ZMYND8-like isoform X2 n=1 Tax=Oscarella lobularis TaxID=121494 RepID=UPI00331349C6
MTDANKEASNDDTSNVYQVVQSPAVPVAEAAAAPASQIDQVATSTSKICLRLKRCSAYEVGSSPRKRQTSEMEPENDSFCWICHCDGSLVCCDTCPRVFHSRCAGSSKSAKPDEKWTCFVCRNVQLSLKKTPLVDLNECLLVVLELMRNVEGSEPFQKPVDVVEFTNYRDWIFNPIDLNLLREKIQNGKYSVPQQFLYDCQWILHNCIIYNGDYGELTTIAKAMMRTCKREIAELLLCPECYILSIRKPSGWFTSACSKAHKPVWAKLRGYPFWPGKVVNQIGDRYDVRFFGDYDRSKVVKASIRNYSNTPSSPSNQLKDWVSACKEMETYVNNLKKAGCIDADLDIFPNRIIKNYK